MTHPSPLLDVQHHGPVTRVFLNRPDLRNAFNEAMVAELAQVFHALPDRPGLRAVVLGSHGKVFCAGADLAWMRAMAGYSEERNQADAQALADMLWTLYQCPVPIVGRIQGDCYAGGMGLAALCDVVVAGEGAQFCLSEVRLGLAPCTISPYVIRAIGQRAAARYFVTGERFGAARAQALGLVHEVCHADALDAKVDEVVRALVSNGPQAVRACKRLVREVAARALDEGLRHDTARWIADIRAGDEGRAGVAAFLERWPMPWLDGSQAPGGPA